MNTRLKRTKLIFPDEQKLWVFFTNTDVAEFRIESSKNVMMGKFRQADVDLAKEKFGATGLKEKSPSFDYTNFRAAWRHFGQSCLAKTQLARS